MTLWRIDGYVGSDDVIPAASRVNPNHSDFLNDFSLIKGKFMVYIGCVYTIKVPSLTSTLFPDINDFATIPSFFSVRPLITLGLPISFP